MLVTLVLWCSALRVLCGADAQSMQGYLPSIGVDLIRRYIVCPFLLLVAIHEIAKYIFSGLALPRNRLGHAGSQNSRTIPRSNLERCFSGSRHAIVLICSSNSRVVYFLVSRRDCVVLFPRFVVVVGLTGSVQVSLHSRIHVLNGRSQVGCPVLAHMSLGSQRGRW
jgi:hypothetical protein